MRVNKNTLKFVLKNLNSAFSAEFDELVECDKAKK